MKSKQHSSNPKKGRKKKTEMKSKENRKQKNKTIDLSPKTSIIILNRKCLNTTNSRVD